MGEIYSKTKAAGTNCYFFGRNRPSVKITSLRRRGGQESRNPHPIRNKSPETAKQDGRSGEEQKGAGNANEPPQSTDGGEGNRRGNIAKREQGENLHRARESNSQNTDRENTKTRKPELNKKNRKHQGTKHRQKQKKKKDQKEETGNRRRGPEKIKKVSTRKNGEKRRHQGKRERAEKDEQEQQGKAILDLQEEK